MLLSNVVEVNTGKSINILISGERIHAVLQPEDLAVFKDIPTVNFEEAVVFPGLINSHDHLDFDLFPQLGNKVYNNYVEWGQDIHQQDKEAIDSVLKVPLEIRVKWGIYKNLLNGVTTVVNHGSVLPKDNELITVWQNSHTLHSVRLEKRWKYKLNRPFIKKQPFSIHIGEGTDEASNKEIDELTQWNLFHRELIGIHAVAINEKQAAKFKAIVWCPDSNYFLLGRTANVASLKNKTKILFGTDSTVSSDWNLWNHLRFARYEKLLPDKAIFSALNSTPADVWGMKDSGSLRKDAYADIVVAKRKPGKIGMDNFFGLGPADILLIMHKGKIRLIAEELYQESKDMDLLEKDFFKIDIHGSSKYIKGNLPKLMRDIKQYYPGAEFPVR